MTDAIAHDHPYFHQDLAVDQQLALRTAAHMTVNAVDSYDKLGSGYHADLSGAMDHRNAFIESNRAVGQLLDQVLV